MLDEFRHHAVTSGIQHISDVTQRTIMDYQIALANSSTRSPHAIYLRLRILRQLLLYLADSGRIKTNPWAGMRLPKQPASLPRRILSRKQVRRILARPDRRTAKGIRDSTILELFYSTGIRLNEMTKLRLNDIDLNNGLLRIEHAKFARSRVVPLGIVAAERMREYLTGARAEWTQEQPTEQAVWLSAPQPHLPVGSAAISSVVRASARAAGLRQPVSPHVWRHTCATHLVAHGAPLPHVQRLLGHCSLNTTQIYARVTVSEIQQTFLRTHPRAQERNAYVPPPIIS